MKGVEKRDQYIVAIGASAGGLEAIHEFFDNMPDNTNVSFFIIQHLSSDHKSLLVELVGRHTHMEVYEAKNNAEVEPNCVYVIPNNKLITLKGNSVLLSEKKENKSPNNAVDVFLQSLAHEKKEKAIAVILSGTGSDGTKGVESVKRNGGLVIVQDPATARFNGMPNSAVHSGLVDAILPVSEIPAEIILYTQRNWVASTEEQIQDPDFLKSVFDLIHTHVGHDFHYYKTPTIIRRIMRRMAKHKIQDAAIYIKKLKSEPEECKDLGKDFLIGVTRFFRDKEAFSELREKFIRPLIAEKQRGDTVKVWICACSTGEEAYSIAILLSEEISQQDKSIEVKIFASDVEEANINIAAKGMYPSAALKDIDNKIVSKYFSRKDKQYTVVPMIRKMVVFAKHNVISDAPYIKNDLVSCRNMLIYMNPALQQKVLSTLLYAVKKGGCLFLGSSENTSVIKNDVAEISEKWKIYRKINETRFSSQSLSYIPPYSRKGNVSPTPEINQLQAPKKNFSLLEEAYHLLNEEMGVVAFFVDHNFDIKETMGDYSQFLTLPRRDLHLNLLRMVPAEASFLISGETRKAIQENKKVIIDPVLFKRDGNTASWKIIIRPLAQQVLIIIIENELKEGEKDQPVFVGNDYGNNYAIALENELNEARKNLQVAIEDLETANEELQSSNEELLSANEELQSSNEELQSLNEELHTLNTEHQLKIKELIELNDDLDNYFRSTDIGQVFLDKGLNIRKFNTAALKVINFIETDMGRPFAHISHNIRYDKIMDDLQEVAKNNTTIEKEISLQSGRNLLMRIMPYLRHDKKNAGIILSFVDITALTQLNNIIRGVFNSSRSAIFAFRSLRDQEMNIEDFVLETANQAAKKLLRPGRNPDEKTSILKGIPILQENGLLEKFRQVAQEDTVWNADMYFEKNQKWYEIVAVKMMDGLVVTLSDITGKKVSEQKLKKNYTELIYAKDKLKTANEELETKVMERTRALSESEERFRLVARATNDALWDWDLVNNHTWWNEHFFTKYGFEEEKTKADRQHWIQRLHPDDRDDVEKSIMAAINSNQSQWNKEYRFKKENGEYAVVLDRGYVLHDEFGTPFRMLGSMFDITELRHAEQQIAKMNEVLEVKVEERTRDLYVLNQALEVSNNDLQQFASVASHDLQEPLRKIQMFANMVQENTNGLLDPVAARYLEKIIISSDRMKALITDILSYSKLSADHSAFTLTDIRKIISGILDDFELSIKEKNARFEVGDLPEIEVIPGQIRQMFHNLISNSLKFCHPKVDPVIIVTSEFIENKTFTSKPSPSGKYLRINFTDNGIGFDQHSAGNIFNLFHRLHSKDKYEGTGIGLAVTKKIVEKHNGLITVISGENEGTTFQIILPVKQDS